jgi:hypothetical protein
LTPHQYRILVKGGLGPAAREAFEGFDVVTRDGFTELSGRLDQAGLFGALRRIEALSLELIAVQRDRDAHVGRLLT